jgi:hypothetical protein
MSESKADEGENKLGVLAGGRTREMDELDERIEKELTSEEKKLVEDYSLYDIMYKNKQLYKILTKNSIVLYKTTFLDKSKRAQHNYITLSINYILDHYFITWYESNPWCDYDWFYTDFTSFEDAMKEVEEIIQENEKEGEQ